MFCATVSFHTSWFIVLRFVLHFTSSFSDNEEISLFSFRMYASYAQYLGFHCTCFFCQQGAIWDCNGLWERGSNNSVLFYIGTTQLGAMWKTSGCNLSRLPARHLLACYLEAIRPHLNILSRNHLLASLNVVVVIFPVCLKHSSFSPASLVFFFSHLSFWTLFIHYFCQLYHTKSCSLLSHLHSSSSSSSAVFYG